MFRHGQDTKALKEKGIKSNNIMQLHVVKILYFILETSHSHLLLFSLSNRMHETRWQTMRSMQPQSKEQDGHETIHRLWISCE